VLAAAPIALLVMTAGVSLPKGADVESPQEVLFSTSHPPPSCSESAGCFCSIIRWRLSYALIDGLREPSRCNGGAASRRIAATCVLGAPQAIRRTIAHATHLLLVNESIDDNAVQQRKGSFCRLAVACVSSVSPLTKCSCVGQEELDTGRPQGLDHAGLWSRTTFKCVQ